MTKAATAANYVFWLRQLKPAVQEDAYKPPFEDEKDNGPAHIVTVDLSFSYPTRPNIKVLNNIDIDVSTPSPS
jgi:ATP-binding cassette subfamily B (MDR/TAP) protein 1